ncbi:hypothetical protein ABIA94_007122 [Bradyrhizobium sp. LA7.1]
MPVDLEAYAKDVEEQAIRFGTTLSRSKPEE